MKFSRLFLVLCLLGLMFLSGCKETDVNYALADEEYVLGWVLHNLNDSSETHLNFTSSEVARYDFMFDYPSSSPKYYSNLLYWMFPRETELPMYWDYSDIAVPNNRTYYVGYKGNMTSFYDSDNWTMYNGVYLDYSTNYYYYEPPIFKTGASEYDGLVPVAGENKSLYFSSVPYKFPKFVLVNNNISLEGHLISDRSGLVIFNNNELNGDFGPSYRVLEIYWNGSGLGGGLTVPQSLDWDLKTQELHPISENLSLYNYSYKINLSIDNYLDIWSNISIVGFMTTKNLSDRLPPYVEEFEILPYFEIGKNYTVKVKASDDDGGIVNVTGSYFDGVGGAGLVFAMCDVSFYCANLSPNIGANNLNVSLKIFDTSNNSIEYEIVNFAKLAQNVAISFDSVADARVGNSVVVYGNVSDEQSEDVLGVLLNISSEGKSVGSTYTSFDNWINWNYEGEFDYEFEVPYNFTKENVTLNMSFEGTGIYLPQKSSVFFNITKDEHDVALSNARYFINDSTEQIVFRGVLYNLGKSNETNVNLTLEQDSVYVNQSVVPSLNVSELLNVELKVKPGTYDTYTYYFRVETVENETYTVNNYDVFYSVDYGSDLYLSTYSVYGVVENQSNELQYYLRNYGELLAKDVLVDVYYFENVTTRVNLTYLNVTEIDSGDREFIVFNWTPSVSGEYVDLYFEVTNLNDISGNNVTNFTKSVYVYSQAPDIEVYEYNYGNYVEDVADDFSINVRNRGVESIENVSVRVSLKPVSGSSYSLVGSSYVGLLSGYFEGDSSEYLTYDWTPSVIGTNTFKVEVNGSENYSKVVYFNETVDPEPVVASPSPSPSPDDDDDDNDKKKKKKTATVSNVAQEVASNKLKGVLQERIRNKYDVLVGSKKIDVDAQEDEVFSGVQTIVLKDKSSSKNRVVISHDFSEKELDLSKVEVDMSYDNATRGFIIVRGVDMSEGETKEVRLPAINGTEYVCVKDAQVSQISELSVGCDGSNEFVVKCDSRLFDNKYKCSVDGSDYVVSGLLHSAVLEIDYDDGLDVVLGESNSSNEDVVLSAESETGFSVPSWVWYVLGGVIVLVVLVVLVLVVLSMRSDSYYDNLGKSSDGGNFEQAQEEGVGQNVSQKSVGLEVSDDERRIRDYLDKYKGQYEWRALEDALVRSGSDEALVKKIIEEYV